LARSVGQAKYDGALMPGAEVAERLSRCTGKQIERIARTSKESLTRYLPGMPNPEA